MRFGVHLPQYGRAAGPAAITRAAHQAEELGLDDVWVSDHIAIPTSAPYPPPYLFEPLISLTWAAAATARVGLGTSILVLPYRHPLHAAKELASLDVLSDSRLILGVSTGWLKDEFDALNVPFHERGKRSDEAIDVFRACWEQRPVDFEGPSVRLHDLQVLPQPQRRIPIWVGGMARPAVRRAVEKGDGWHGAFMNPQQAAPVVRKLRDSRPEPDFAISMRLDLDGIRDAIDDVAARVEQYEKVGITHLVACPMQRDLDSWLRSVEALNDVFAKFR